MTRSDAIRVLGLLCAAPWAGSGRAEAMPDPTAEIWVAGLSKFDAARAVRVVGLLAEESRFMPSLAEFRTRYEQVQRHERQAQPALPADGTGPALTNEQQRANVRRVRELMAGLDLRADRVLGSGETQ